MASEKDILYSILARITAAHREVAHLPLVTVANLALIWPYKSEPVLPPFIPADDIDVVKSKLSFWKLVNSRVCKEGPFLPLKLFKHVTQCFDSKTKGGVDGATQQRAVLQSKTSHLSWEQKMVSQFLKTPAINDFFVWRTYKQRELLSSYTTFKSLEAFCNVMKKLQSTAGFMLDASLNLLAHSQKLRNTQASNTVIKEPIGGDKV